MPASCPCRSSAIRLFVRGVSQVHSPNDRLSLPRTPWHESRPPMQTYRRSHARVPAFASISCRAVHNISEDGQPMHDGAAESMSRDPPQAHRRVDEQATPIREAEKIQTIVAHAQPDVKFASLSEAIPLQALPHDPVPSQAHHLSGGDTLFQVDEIKIPSTSEQRIDEAIQQVFAPDHVSRDALEKPAGQPKTDHAKIIAETVTIDSIRKALFNSSVEDPANKTSSKNTRFEQRHHFESTPRSDQTSSLDERPRFESTAKRDDKHQPLNSTRFEKKYHYERNQKSPRSEWKSKGVKQTSNQDAMSSDVHALDIPEEKAFSVADAVQETQKQREESAYERERRRGKERRQRLVQKEQERRERMKQRKLEKPHWAIQKEALKEKFPEGWRPRKRLSPDALNGIRALNQQFPDVYNAESLSQKFEMSPEAIRRILRSKWQPKADEEEDRMRRWRNRGISIWERYAAMGINPPKQWREAGVGASKNRGFGPNTILDTHGGFDDSQDLDERMSPEEFRAEMQRKRRLQYQERLSESLL